MEDIIQPTLNLGLEPEVIKKLEEIELFHFTDKRNLDSINKHGLLGWETLEKKPYQYIRDVDYFPGCDAKESGDYEGNIYEEGWSRYLDKEAGLTNYIRLSSHKTHYMVRKAPSRGLDLIFLKISNKVITELACLFTNQNANKKWSLVIDNDINTFLNSDDSHAEILVHQKIPVNYIIGQES